MNEQVPSKDQLATELYGAIKYAPGKVISIHRALANRILTALRAVHEPGLLHGVPRDRAIWICSVCNGWNHVRDKFCTHTHAANAEGGAPVNMLVADSAQPPCDDLKEATRLLHVVNAWCWRASDDPDPARVDPLYPSRGVHNSKAPLFTAIRALLDRHPYGGPSLTKGDAHG